jgi:hypothetical protein
MLTLDSFDGCKAKCKKCKNYFEIETSVIAPLFKILKMEPFLCLCDPCYSRWVARIQNTTMADLEAFLNER